MKRLLFVLAVAACKKDPTPAPVPVASASAAPAPSDDARARDLLAAWDRGFNAHDAMAVIPAYAPSVRYYGASLSREDCKTRIATFIGANPTLAQTSTVDAIASAPDGVRVDFTKAVTIAGATKRYPSHVHLVRSGSALQIDEESDAVTDKKLCEDALATIARTTDGISGGKTEVQHDAGTWTAVYFRSHGYNQVDFDPKTGKFHAGMSDINPEITPDEALAAVVKQTCR